MGFDINQKHQKNNRTSSDLMDKIIQNRNRKEGWERVEEGWRVFSLFSPLPVFRFYIYIYIYIYISVSLSK